jgi:hypothetical protein
MEKSLVEEKFGNLDKLFNEADTNQDGYISPKEALVFFQRFRVSREILKKVILIFNL